MTHRRAPRPLRSPSRRSAPPSGSPSPAAPEDAWVDVVVDEVEGLLTEEGLELELLVFHDPVTEVLHAVGYDGSPAKFLREVDVAPGPAPDHPAGPLPSLEGARLPCPPGPAPRAPKDPTELPWTALAGSGPGEPEG